MNIINSNSNEVEHEQEMKDMKWPKITVGCPFGKTEPIPKMTTIFTQNYFFHPEPFWMKSVNILWISLVCQQCTAAVIYNCEELVFAMDYGCPI